MKASRSLILLWAALAGCVQPSDRELAKGPSLAVVNAHFAPGLPWRISLSRSLPLDELQIAENIPDGQVLIYEEGRLIGEAVYEPPPLAAPPYRAYYRWDKPAQEGRRYEVRVRAPGLPEARAQDQVPSSGGILSQFQLLGLDTARRVLQAEIMLRDTAPEANYFHLLFWTRPRSDTTARLAASLAVDEAFNDPLNDDGKGLILSLGENTGLLIDDRTFSQSSRSLVLTLLQPAGAQARGQIEVQAELRSVSLAYYTYYQSLLRHLALREDPFSEPLRVFNNVEQGLGNVSAYRFAYSGWVLIR